MREFTNIDLDKNRIEEWKDIKGYEGFYKVSNRGRVKSLTRDVRNARWGVETRKVLPGAILNQSNYKNGYVFVTLCKLGVPLQYMVHRLVAKAFIPNPEKKRTVNHMNGIKDDNRVENLEWATHSENNIHANKTGLTKMNGGDNPYASKIQISNGDTVKTFQTQRQAAQFLGVKDINISSAKIKGTKCKGYKITQL